MMQFLIALVLFTIGISLVGYAHHIFKEDDDEQ